MWLRITKREEGPRGRACSVLLTCKIVTDNIYKNAASIIILEQANIQCGPDLICRSLICNNAQGEPTASYRWTGWGWETTSSNWRLQENYWSIWRNYSLILNKEKNQNQLVLETLGSWPVMPKTLHGHWYI